MFEIADPDDGINDDDSPRSRTHSNSHLLVPDRSFGQTSSPSSKNERSSPSPTSSTSSLSTKSNLSSFLKISSPNRTKVPNSSSSDDRFVMTIIRSPSSSSQRPPPSPSSIEPVMITPPLAAAAAASNEDPSNNNKFFKSKVTAALNHMKYRWAVKIRPNFRTNESPIFLLGKVYNGKEETSFDDSPRSHSDQSYSHFLKSFAQRIYFSYRKPFDPISTRNGDYLTSDCGWGCMIRCAQMLLAQTLVLQMTNTLHSCFSNIQISDKCPKRNSIDYFRHGNRTTRRNQIYMDIIRLFGDHPNEKCPFGIHKMVELGTAHGIRPGEFFGPVSAAHCLKEALQIAIETHQYPDTLRIYISQDAIIYRQDVNDLCSQTSNSTTSNHLYPSLDTLIHDPSATRWTSSVLILVPLRLGLNELDLIYEDYLKEALKLPQTVGIIGGSPRHAVYILGFQDESFIDLDPHFCQTTVNVLDKNFDLSTFSCSSPKKLSTRKMDPSCTLGFYCRDKAEFEMFCAQWNRVCHLASEDRRTCPIFRIERGTFEENHLRTITSDYPSLQDDENVFLRVTKLSSPNTSPLSFNKKLLQHGKNSLFNSSSNNVTYRDSWDDADQTLSNPNRTTLIRSLSDDYVFL